VNDHRSRSPESDAHRQLNADDIRVRLKNNLSLVASYLVVVAVIPITSTVVVTFGIVPVESDQAAFVFIFTGLGPLMIALAIAIWRGCVWPVYVVLGISYPLAVTLCLWIEPAAAILFCGVPVLAGHSVVLRIYQLRKMGEPLFA